MMGFDPIRTGLAAAAPPAGKTAPAPMTDIHDIKPVLDIAGHWPWVWIAVGAAALLLAALGWWLWRRRKRPEKPAAAGAPALPPDAEALAALEALCAQTGMAPRKFYFRLSAILRRYIERRYEIPAAEMTSEELLPRMDRLQLDRRLTEAFKAFCRETDPIKFAGAAAHRDQMDRNLTFCRDFVRRTAVVSIEEGTE
jgi:LPXTG-motif cell wall-anchored protein